MPIYHNHIQKLVFRTLALGQSHYNSKNPQLFALNYSYMSDYDGFDPTKSRESKGQR